MREAMIILPHFENDQHTSLKHVRTVIAKSLMRAFGGCTIRSSHSSWLDSKGHAVIEPVWEMVVACADTPANAQSIRALAIEAGRLGKQATVYCRLPSGDVEIIDTAPKATLARAS